MRYMPKNKIMIVLLISGIILLVGAILYFTGKRGGKMITVGKQIKKEDITDFYFTYDSSTDPPMFQRYRFFKENDVCYFYHETREGRHWPLTENDITVSGKKELTEEEWNTFYGFVEGGTVAARGEHLESGGSGPWTFLYWKKDKSVYQEFSFASFNEQKSFEDYCIRLKSGME